MAGIGAGDGNRKHHSGDGNHWESESYELVGAPRAIYVRKTVLHEPPPASAGFVDQGEQFDTGAEGGFSNLRVHAHFRHELRHQVMLI
jgi:hypothetical protein